MRRFLAVPLVIVTCIISFATSSYASYAAPASLAILSTQINAALTTGKSPVSLGPAVTTENNSEYSNPACLQRAKDVPTLSTCVFGDPAAATTVVLYGDSNAAMWQPAFDKIGKARHFKVILMARLGCTFTDVTLGNTWLGGKADANCATFRANAVAAITALKKPRVVVAELHRYPKSPSGAAISATAWNSATVRSLTKLRSISSSLTWLLGVPAPPDQANATTIGQPALCLSQHLTDTRPCNFSTARGIITANQSDDQKSATATGTSAILVTSLFCQSGTLSPKTLCPLQVNGVLPYADAWHVTASYATYISTPLAQLLGRQIP